MLSGANSGKGGPRLSGHLANPKKETCLAANGSPELGDDPREALRQLEAMGEIGRTSLPIYSSHVDPDADQPLTDQFDQVVDIIRRQDAEFGFEQAGVYALHWQGDGQAPSLGGASFDPYDDDSVSQIKSALDGHSGRLHGHVVRLTIDLETGTRLNLSHDYARRERLCRESEFDHGRPFTKAAQNKAVYKHLCESRPEVAEAMKAAGLLQGDRPIGQSPAERHQAERTKIETIDVQAAALKAWESSDTAKAFEAALSEHGFALVEGDKGPRLMDPSGSTHDLRRTLNRASKAAGYDKTIRKADVERRVGNSPLPTVEQAMQAKEEARHEAVPDTESRPSQEDTTTDKEEAGFLSSPESGPENQPDDAPDDSESREEYCQDRLHDAADIDGTDGPRRERRPEPHRADHSVAGAGHSRSEASAHVDQRDRKEAGQAHRVASLKLDAAGSQPGRPARLRALLDDAGRLTDTPASLARQIRLEASTAASRVSRLEDADAILKKRLKPLKTASTEAFWKVAGAEKAIEKLRASKPVGFIAAITGRTRRWRQQHDRLQAQLDAAKAEHSDAHDALNEASISQAVSARREAADNRRDNAADLERARRLTAAADAIEAGDRNTIDTARTGDRKKMLDAGQQWARQQAEQRCQREIKERKRLQAAKVRKPKRPTPSNPPPSPRM
ncbi:hypothetical protein ACM64Y_14900 [Novispirillum sp. DQ9]|uniref:hypothetical protein n=1 Tax=Novispirillum sp. DQ9 TaxID=3398612 RepID=UPI003C7E5CF2